eukprot:TRINITY_DN776214_c0_g1_i1.p1 TRINITY_DN776214_c0_g1~~TRINITY_DN776214_c0_g1_i1.p1  ORF type:complete len:168 (+),score=21.11 TRINITY_DN776214_c0_g1_i1:68-571(+)
MASIETNIAKILVDLKQNGQKFTKKRGRSVSFSLLSSQVPDNVALSVLSEVAAKQHDQMKEKTRKPQRSMSFSNPNQFSNIHEKPLEEFKRNRKLLEEFKIENISTKDPQRNKFVGAYSPKSRRQLLLRFKKKRNELNWAKNKVRYDCRKQLADSRKRVKGRFVKAN